MATDPADRCRLALPSPVTCRDGELLDADGRIVAVVMSAFSGFSLPTAHATGRKLALAYTVHDQLVAALKWGVERIEEDHDRERSKCWCAEIDKERRPCDHCLDIQFRDSARAVLATVARLGGAADAPQ